MPYLPVQQRGNKTGDGVCRKFVGKGVSVQVFRTDPKVRCRVLSRELRPQVQDGDVLLGTELCEEFVHRVERVDLFRPQSLEEGPQHDSEGDPSFVQASSTAYTPSPSDMSIDPSPEDLLSAIQQFSALSWLVLFFSTVKWPAPQLGPMHLRHSRAPRSFLAPPL